MGDGPGLPAIIRRGVLRCPVCGHDKLHQKAVEVFQRFAEDSAAGSAFCLFDAGLSLVLPMEANPSERRDGIRIHFSCEDCDLERPGVEPLLIIVQHKGETLIEWETV